MAGVMTTAATRPTLLLCGPCLDSSSSAGSDMKEDNTWRIFRMLDSHAGLLAKMMRPGVREKFRAQMAQKISNRCDKGCKGHTYCAPLFWELCT